MEEIPNNHPGCKRQCKLWDIYHINWCRIFSINSMVAIFMDVSCLELGTCFCARKHVMLRCALLESWGKALSLGTCHAPQHIWLQSGLHVILSMEDILHQLICSLSHDLQILQGFTHRRWCFGFLPSTARSFSKIVGPK